MNRVYFFPIVVVLLLSFPAHVLTADAAPEGYKGSPQLSNSSRSPNEVLRIFDLPEDARLFLLKEEHCARLLKTKEEFKNNLRLLSDLEYSMKITDCNTLACERSVILNKYKNEYKLYAMLTSYTDREVKNWFAGGTQAYYTNNVCTAPLDPNKPPANPYDSESVRRRTMEINAEPIPANAKTLTQNQYKEVMKRLEAMGDDQTNPEIVNRVIDEVLKTVKPQ